jgi:hypothetical protein
LQCALWLADRKQETLNLYDRRLYLLSYSPLCNSQRINVLCELMERCFQVLSTTSSKRERLKFNDVFNDALRRADHCSDKADSFALANLMSWHCVDDYLERNFEKARRHLNTMIYLRGKTNQELSEKQLTCFDTVLRAVAFEKGEKLKNSDVFGLAEMLLLIHSAPVARDSKEFPKCILHCRRILQERFPEPPTEASVRKRYDDIAARISQAESKP